jgi:hypothetical protein
VSQPHQDTSDQHAATSSAESTFEWMNRENPGCATNRCAAASLSVHLAAVDAESERIFGGHKTTAQKRPRS